MIGGAQNVCTNILIMKNYKILKSNKYTLGKFSLGPILDKDIEKIRVWRNEQIDVLRQNTIITSEQQDQYYKNNVWSELSQTNPSQILLSFRFEDRLIGYGGLVYIDWKQMKAEMSFLVETIRTKNPDIYYNDMKNFILILKLIALNELKMCEIITETYTHRLSHISFLEQNGFLLSKKENSSLYHSLKRGQ